ncbi:oxidoreductase [Xylaria flabelliformis]|nr:oxidoreductase [Xylaria flabelliformis]
MGTESFDFIIVGGGTAGIALASRLSEVAHQKVLVLEAGLDHSDDPRVKTPAFYSTLFGTDADWGFRTIAQQKLDGRSISLSQGKALGGSSVINAHVWAPPTKDVLEAWVELGNEGWDWDTMSFYYTKAFTLPQTPEELQKPLGVHGWGPDNINTNGPLQLSYPGTQTHPIREAWAETFKGMGYFTITNPQASVGAFSNLASIDPVKRERNHAAKAYYSPVRDRQNLHVVLDAHVEKIIFANDQPHPRATGVQYRHGGKVRLAQAQKEIIISAGALQSPKLLELSGIGNANILKQYNIEVIKDLPNVGENLQDHLVCDIGFAVANEMETLDGLVRQDPEVVEEAVIQFTQDHDGLLTSGGIKTFAYLPITEFLSGTGRERLVNLLEENRPQASPTLENARARRYYEIVEKTLLDPNRPSGAYLTAISQNPIASDPSTGKPLPPQPGKHLTIAAILAQPLSRGTVHITSSDSAEPPEVDPKYLSNPLDREVFAEHIKYIESIASSAPLSDLLKKPLERNSLLAYITDSNAALRYMESRAISMWHPAGTCAMLPEKLGGVVDASLRVHGVDSLRVVDASVIPLLPPGNLQSTVYAIAERAADLIKETHALV